MLVVVQALQLVTYHRQALWKVVFGGRGVCRQGGWLLLHNVEIETQTRSYCPTQRVPSNDERVSVIARFVQKRCSLSERWTKKILRLVFSRYKYNQKMFRLISVIGVVLRFPLTVSGLAIWWKIEALLPNLLLKFNQRTTVVFCKLQSVTSWINNISMKTER